AERTAWNFAVLIKLPILAADLGIVALLFAWPARGQDGPRAAWIYALHPVALLITGFHGQFDPLMLLAVLGALRFREAGRHDRSALALAAAIGLKSFPVLLLPVLAPRGGVRPALRYALLATLPVALLLLPFAIADSPALLRELGGYGGIADFGWIGLARGLAWLRSGTLPRSEARHWGLWVPLAKLLFLAAYAGLLALYRRERAGGSALEAT